MKAPRIIFFGKGRRGQRCLDAVFEAGHDVALVVWQGNAEDARQSAGRHDLDLAQYEDPNAPAAIQRFSSYQPDIFVLAGYGKIFADRLRALPTFGCINLHAGRVPDHRGSSPLNWSLINGEVSFGLSVLSVDEGIDTGDVLENREFPILPDDTIADLHEIADREFPAMLLKVLAGIESGDLRKVPQDVDAGTYYPMRFPEDGMILWDVLAAGEIHNRIRALTEPYPCAFTIYNERRIRLITSALHNREFRGEPGRIYQISLEKGLLVMARDRALWLTHAVFADDGSPLVDAIERYDRLATVEGASLKILEGRHSK